MAMAMAMAMAMETVISMGLRGVEERRSRIGRSRGKDETGRREENG
jgi:hypothetical protein